MGRRKRSLLAGGRKVEGADGLADEGEALDDPTGEEPDDAAEAEAEPTSSDADSPPEPSPAGDSPPEPSPAGDSPPEPSPAGDSPPEPPGSAAGTFEPLPGPPVGPEVAPRPPIRLDDPSVVDEEFVKASAFPNPADRPDDPTAKTPDDDDDWYLRTGQPAPPREEDEDGPTAPRASDLQHYGPALALLGVVALLVLLILLFGVFLN